MDDTCAVRETHKGVVAKRSMSHSPKLTDPTASVIEIAGLGCAKHGGSHGLSRVTHQCGT